MPKKLPPAELEKIIQPLPAKERLALQQQDLTPEWLEAEIARRQKLMKRDVWVGIPWFVIYSIVYFTKGFGNLTIAIGVLGLIYFAYAIFTGGSYGMNRKKVKVYEELLEKLKG
ncbi:MAG: hypothetical protein AAB316_03745 [Bacteroidota bacterium]